MTYKAKIKKDQVDAFIRTAGEKIEGKIYKLPNGRMLDMLNNESENFLPVTGASVYSATTGKLLFEADFLAINKSRIVFIADNYRAAKM